MLKWFFFIMFCSSLTVLCSLIHCLVTFLKTNYLVIIIIISIIVVEHVSTLAKIFINWIKLNKLHKEHYVSRTRMEMSWYLRLLSMAYYYHLFIVVKFYLYDILYSTCKCFTNIYATYSQTLYIEIKQTVYLSKYSSAAVKIIFW